MSPSVKVVAYSEELEGLCVYIETDQGKRTKILIASEAFEKKDWDEIPEYGLNLVTKGHYV